MTEIACAIFQRDDKILLVRRAEHKERYADSWDLIGGHVEPGESIEAAMVREAKEEVGLTPVTFRKLAVVTEPQENGAADIRFHLYLVSAWLGGEPRLLGDEHTAMQWLTPDQACAIEDLGHPQWRSIFKGLPLGS